VSGIAVLLLGIVGAIVPLAARQPSLKHGQIADAA
jgi:hypothetical protein